MSTTPNWLKPKFATEEDCKANWGGEVGGKYFRCALCGFKFSVGDYYRIVYTNSMDGKYSGNPIVCAACDDEEVITKWKALCDYMRSDRFWWFVQRS